MLECIWLSWKCPLCGEINVDSFLMTAMPYCAYCDNDMPWDNILTEEEMNVANERKESYEKK